MDVSLEKGPIPLGATIVQIFLYTDEKIQKWDVDWPDPLFMLITKMPGLTFEVSGIVDNWFCAVSCPRRLVAGSGKLIGRVLYHWALKWNRVFSWSELTREQVRNVSALESFVYI